MQRTSILVVLFSGVFLVHGGFTLAQTLVLEDKVARLEALVETQEDAANDLNSCTQLLSKVVRQPGLRAHDPATPGLLQAALERPSADQGAAASNAP